MRLKAAFFLFVMLFSLGSAWATQVISTPDKGCCATMEPAEECERPSSHEKKECNPDYCNPFLSCSSTPAVLTKTLNIPAPIKAIKKDYFLYDIGANSNFSSKHWQPPRIKKSLF